MKRVLIITYYWPPSGGSGVQRWLKMTKYLPESGWMPVVFTPEDPSFRTKDHTLLSDVRPDIEVIKFPIREPVELFYAMFRIRGKKEPEQKDLLAQRNQSFFQRASTWIRGNLFLPDGRIFWVNPSVKFLRKYLTEHPVDAVITTGPPHSLHLIGLKLKHLFPGLWWVADFRDPWSEWDVLDKLKTGASARRKIQKMERAVLAESNMAFTISPYHAGRLQALGATNVHLIYNGYDHADFVSRVIPATDSFLIRHLGYVDDLRDPRPFMAGLKVFLSEHPEAVNNVRLEFYGSVDQQFIDHVNKEPVLNSVTHFLPEVSHAQVPALMQSSTLLLLVLSHSAIAAGNLPGKMFEYMASRRPILATGDPAGDAAVLLKKSDTGRVIARDQSTQVANELNGFYKRWISGESLETNGATGFSRQAISAQVAGLLDQA